MKKTIYYTTIFALFFLLTAESLFAGAGSAYSRFGVGERRFFIGGRAAAMGGIGIALRGPIHFNPSNPASWSDISFVHFSGSILYEGFNMQDGINSSTIGNGNLNGLMLALPLMPSRGLTIAFGLGPFTDVGYNIESIQEITEGQQYITHTGNGGITNAILGFSYRLHTTLRLGGTFIYRTGILQYEWASAYSIPGYGGGSTSRTTNLHGYGGTIGVLYSGILSPRVGQSIGPLSLGLIFSFSAPLDVEETFRLRYATGYDTTSVREGTVSLPYFVGIGVGYQIDNLNLIAADVRYEPWSEFKKFGESDSQLRDLLRIGAGWEKQGIVEPGSGFFERMTYRLGFLYNASYFYIQETPINELYVTAGAGIPISAFSVLNVGLQIGTRGTTANGLQRDTIFRMFFSINMIERWFVPPVRD